MKNLNVYHQRLITLANHLEGIEAEAQSDPQLCRLITFCEVKNGRGIEVEVIMRIWLYNTFSEIIGECGKDISDPESNIEGDNFLNVLDYFGLSFEQFCHCFDLAGNQDVEEFGGQKLDEDSTGADIARNIHELLKSPL